MRRATLALASVLLLAGFATACGDDSGDDAKDDETTSATPTDTESSASDPSSDSSTSSDPSDTPSSESPDPESSAPAGDTGDYCAAVEEASDAKEVDELRPAVEKIAEHLPDEASDEAEAGLEFLQEALADAKDMDDFTERVQKAGDDDKANVQEYGSFESTTCASSDPTPDAPTASPS